MLSYFKLASKYAFIAKDTLGALSYYKNEELGYYFMGKYDSVFIINLKFAANPFARTNLIVTRA